MPRRFAVAADHDAFYAMAILFHQSANPDAVAGLRLAGVGGGKTDGLTDFRMIDAEFGRIVECVPVVRDDCFDTGRA